MSGATRPVAVAIVGYRNRLDIARCLRALDRSAYADFEVVICENGGRAAFEDLCDHLPAMLTNGQPVRIIEAQDNLGYAGGVNVCLAAAPDVDAWWVLNPDTEPRPDALGHLADRLARGDCDAVGGVLFRADGSVQSYGGRWRSWLARAQSLGMGEPVGSAVDAAAIERDQSYLNGACMLIGRRFLETAGPMREDYFLYCEEVEWCLRASGLGLRLGFAPACLVLHHQGTTTGARDEIRRRPRPPVYLDERNKILVTRDRFAHRLPIAAMAAMGLAILRYAPKGAWRQLGYAGAGWWAGILNRRGRPGWMPG